MIRTGIVGSAGYTGGELIRLLLHHPFVEIVFAHSNTHPEKALSDVHTDLVGETDLRFSDAMTQDVDLVFFCTAHGTSRSLIAEYPWLLEKNIIDLSSDYRIGSFDRDFVYGLPELQHEKISSSKHIANPGCFATAIQLALLPLAGAGHLRDDIHVSAITGSTGAGQSFSDTAHFSWRSSNVQVYKPFEHQHVPEIIQSLRQLQPGFISALNFIPMRGNFTRGILASVYTRCILDLDAATDLFNKYYEPHPFTHVVSDNIDLKRVVNTNKALLHLEKHGDQLLVVCVIDNLLKGASGQALQNMNIMYGLDEKLGLQLKGVVF